ncbi:hypothetical protein D3C76_1454700 [compost metagenome]
MPSGILLHVQVYGYEVAVPASWLSMMNSTLLMLLPQPDRVVAAKFRLLPVSAMLLLPKVLLWLSVNCRAT